MDDLVKRFDAVQDKDLMVIEHRGIAYQSDMRRLRVVYDDSYWKKVEAYENSDIAISINHARCQFVLRNSPSKLKLIDVGAGTGAFIRAADSYDMYARGFDVMKKANERLVKAKAYSTDISAFNVVTMWDTLEHMDNPSNKLRSIVKGSRVFVSLPIFQSLGDIRSSKHYRPGEHLYYFTRDGFVGFMEVNGFRLIEESNHEVECGRESIGAFAFAKDLPDYHDNIAAYMEMHATRFYGSSSAELHLERVAEVVKKLRPLSIVDYGCGRSDLVSYFWHDGARRIAKYDPAIPTYKEMPTRRFDLAFCCDVLEHVPMAYVQRVLDEVRALSSTAVFTISTKLARAKLPDGRNAHVTLLRRSEWLSWIESVFGKAREVKTEWEHELFIVAGEP